MADVNQSGEGTGSGEGSATAGSGASDRMRDSFNEHVTAPAMRASEAMRDTGRKVVEGGSAIGARMIDQAEANASQAFAAMRAAAGAKDMSEVMRIQADFLREQSSRAMDQAREIGDMIVRFGRDAASAPGGGANSDGLGGQG